MSADAAAADAADAADADADAAAERRLNHSIPRTYFVRGIQLLLENCSWTWRRASNLKTFCWKNRLSAIQHLKIILIGKIYKFGYCCTTVYKINTPPTGNFFIWPEYAKEFYLAMHTSMHDITYSMHHIQYASHTVCITYSMHHIQYASHTVCITYSMHHIQYASHTVCITYSMHHIQYASHTVCITYSMHHIQYASHTVCITLFYLAGYLYWASH